MCLISLSVYCYGEYFSNIFLIKILLNFDSQNALTVWSPFFSTWNRWDYANPGYLDALKHLTDLKDEGLNLFVLLLFHQSIVSRTWKIKFVFLGKIKTVALTNFDTERLQIILENDIPVVSNQVNSITWCNSMFLISLLSAKLSTKMHELLYLGATFSCWHASSTENGWALSANGSETHNVFSRLLFYFIHLTHAP